MLNDLWCRHLQCSSTFPYTGKTDGIEEGLGDHVMMKLMNSYFDTGLNVITEIFLQTFVL